MSEPIFIQVLNLHIPINESKLPILSGQEESISIVSSSSSYVACQNINDDVLSLVSDLVIKIDERSTLADVSSPMLVVRFIYFQIFRSILFIDQTFHYQCLYLLHHHHFSPLSHQSHHRLLLLFQHQHHSQHLLLLLLLLLFLLFQIQVRHRLRHFLVLLPQHGYHLFQTLLVHHHYILLHSPVSLFHRVLAPMGLRRSLR